MHEMSIAQNIIDIVSDAIGDEEPERVDKVGVRIGKLVAVVPDSLQFCFEAITSGTPLEGAELVIEEVPIRVHCDPCAADAEVESFVFRCPRCGGGELRVLSGNELTVGYIEVE